MKKKALTNLGVCLALVLGVCTIFSCQSNPDDVCKKCVTTRYLYHLGPANPPMVSILSEAIVCGEAAIEAAEITVNGTHLSFVIKDSTICN